MASNKDMNELNELLRQNIDGLSKVEQEEIDRLYKKMGIEKEEERINKTTKKEVKVDGEYIQEDKIELKPLELKAVVDKKTVDFVANKISKVAEIKDGGLRVELELNSFLDAAFPRIILEKSGGAITSMAQLYKEYPATQKIMEEEIVLRLDEFSDFMATYGKEAIGNSKTIEQGIKKTVKLIGDNFDGLDKYKGVKGKDIEREYQIQQRNMYTFQVNQQALTEGYYFQIVNYSHTDYDICDDYIDQYYNADTIIRPPYHPNCRCEIRIVDKSEYTSNEED